MTGLTEPPERDRALDVETSVCKVCGWDGMNQGDYYSGPYGFTPGLVYPETQHGSGFDEDDERNR